MTKSTITAALLTIALSACSANASLVRQESLGGRVQLQGAYMPAMSEARMLMVEHCAGHFETIEHGDTVDFRCIGTNVTGRQYATR